MKKIIFIGIAVVGFVLIMPNIVHADSVLTSRSQVDQLNGQTVSLGRSIFGDGPVRHLFLVKNGKRYRIYDMPTAFAWGLNYSDRKSISDGALVSYFFSKYPSAGPLKYKKGPYYKYIQLYMQYKWHPVDSRLPQYMKDFISEQGEVLWNAEALEWNSPSISYRLSVLFDWSYQGKLKYRKEATMQWAVYNNQELGYTLQYPKKSAITEEDGSVTFVGKKQGKRDKWPVFSVTHTDSDFYNPPAGTDVKAWVEEFVSGETEVADGVAIDDLTTYHTRVARSSQAYAVDNYYFIKDSKLFRIQIVHNGDMENWEIYDYILSHFDFVLFL